MTGGIRVPGAAEPRGRYPHLKVAAGLVFVSGTSSRRPDGTIAGATDGPHGLVLDIAIQTRTVVETMASYLAHVGADLSDVTQITTYLVDMDDFPVYNEVYGSYFSADGPARTTVGVQSLPHPHLLVEMQAIAVLRRA